MTNAPDRIVRDHSVARSTLARGRANTSEAADGDETRDPLYVASVEKAVRVLQAFRDAGPSVSLTEIAERTGLGKSASQRFCHTLVALGYLERDPRTRQLKPSPQLLDFSYIFLASDPFTSIAAPFLLRAREKCGEAVNLALPLGHNVMYVIRLPSVNASLTNPLIGGCAPMFCTSSGRSYLSTLPPEEAATLVDGAPRTALTSHTVTDRDEILTRVAGAREAGFATAYQECIYGEITVGAPIWGRNRRGVGAMNICVTMPGWTLERVRDELAPIACQTAHEISQALAASPAG